MKRIKTIAFSLIILCFAAFSGVAQTTSSIVKTNLSQAEIDNIIKKMSDNEEEFRIALSNYVFNRKATIQEIGLGGQIAGTYRRDSFLTFTKDGKRFERIVFSPVSTLRNLQITPADLDDLGGINPFAIKPSEISLYNFNYLGKEKIDELDLHVFEVSPKVMPNPKKSDLRLFQGRIWIDDRDLMIVKSKGKAVPEGKDKQGNDQRFPIVETWRENVDGKYWFPSYSSADDELVFDSGNVLKMRMRVQFTDYAQGRSSVQVLDDEEPVEDNPTPIPSPTPTPKKP
jgi:hypothetical protein